MALNRKRKAGEMKALQEAKDEMCIVDFQWTGEVVKDGRLCESVQVNSSLKHPLLVDNLSKLPSKLNP